MMKDNLKEISETLREIHKKGFEIRDILKEKYNNHPTSQVNSYYIAKLLVNPELFYYQLFESFWKLFKMISDEIENPLIQSWIRVNVEQSLDMVWYYQQKENKKRDIACKYWLCDIGFIGGKQGNLDYDDFLSLLENKKDKTKFLNLKERGFPKKEFNTERENLFPKVNEIDLPDFIERYFLNLKGNPIKRDQLNSIYKDMSMYHHPNISVTMNLEREIDDKSHIFRCFTLMSACAIVLIRFSTDEIIKKPKLDFSEDFYKKINELIKRAYQGRR